MGAGAVFPDNRVEVEKVSRSRWGGAGRHHCLYHSTCSR